MEIELGKGGEGKAKGLGILGVGLAVALALLDFVVLRGQVVETGRARLSGEQPAVLELVESDQQHLIEITTKRRRSGETKGRSVDYRLVDPDGNVLVEESEAISRKHRYVKIVPERTGEYQLFVQDQGLFGPASGSADVSVLVGDRRLLRRFSF